MPAARVARGSLGTVGLTFIARIFNGILFQSTPRYDTAPSSRSTRERGQEIAQVTKRSVMFYPSMWAVKAQQPFHITGKMRCTTMPELLHYQLCNVQLLRSPAAYSRKRSGCDHLFIRAFGLNSRSRTRSLYGYL
jgi:hypothetical protein